MWDRICKRLETRPGIQEPTAPCSWDSFLVDTQRARFNMRPNRGGRADCVFVPPGRSGFRGLGHQLARLGGV